MFSRNGSGRGLLQVLFGTVGAQIILVATLPVLSRIYSPEDFGYFSFVLAVTAVIVPFATLRFETAAMLPEQDSEVRGLVWNGTLATAVISVASAVLFLALEMAGLSEHGNVWIWLGPLVLISGIYAILSQLVLRRQNYRLVSTRAFVRAGGTVGAQTLLGIWVRSSDGLLLGALLGNLLGIGSMYREASGYMKFPGWRSIGSVWRTYWRFPAVFAPSALLNAVGLQVPVIFFVIWFGLDVGGQLGMAERVAGLPLMLIGLAVSQVLDAEVSKRIRDGEGGVRRLFERYTLLLGGLAVLVFVGFAALGAIVIPWALGEEWRLAGLLVQALALNAAVRLVASPLSRFLVLLQKSSSILILDGIRVALVAASIGLVVAAGFDAITAVWVVYSALTSTYVLTWIWSYISVYRRGN